MMDRDSDARLVSSAEGRGVIHLHAIVRLDVPDGPGSTPPAEVTAGLLEGVVRSAAERARVVTPAAPGVPERELAWGAQLDIRPITANHGDDDRPLTDVTVAKYVAKYATKSAEGRWGRSQRR